jgi:hypothetical protein
MIKRALVIALGFLGFCFPLTAQRASPGERSTDEIAAPRQLRRPSALDTPAKLTLSRPEIFSATNDPVLTRDSLMLTLGAGQRSPAWSELGWIGMAPLDPFQDELPSAVELE